MSRWPSTAFLVVLLAATAAAYALAGRARLERGALLSASVDPTFAPDCSCRTSAAAVRLRLRDAERLTVWMERRGERVRTLVSGRSYPAGRVELVFDGVSDSGDLLEDGAYVPVVHLGNERRTVRLRASVRLDSRPPVVTVRHPIHAIISPDGDGRKDAFAVPFAVDERAHGILLVNAPPAERRERVATTRTAGRRGTLAWDGRLGGHAARPRNYVLYASARDTAGNVADPVPFAVVQVRYVALGRKRIVVRPGGKIAIRVSSDAAQVRWLLRGRTGVARPGTLRLRAPRSQGVFRLYVTAAGHAATAAVVVA